MKTQSGGVRPKVLILGAMGNLGSQLVREYERTGNYEVTAYGHLDLDVENLGMLTDAVPRLKPDIVINAAARNSVDACESSEVEFMRARAINGDVPACLARLSLRLNAKLIHYSTNYVFDGQRDSYLETDPAEPVNRYGMTKKMGEDGILEHAQAGLNYYIIRTSNLFGPKGSSSTSKRTFFDLIREASTKRSVLDLVADERSRFTYSVDLARATRELVEERERGIYHVTNDGDSSWYDAAVVYFGLIGQSTSVRPLAAEMLSRPARRPRSAILKDSRLPPMRSYLDALREYAQSYNLKTDF
jgi:dTDP-4-dehydrorhamnose reductase